MMPVQESILSHRSVQLVRGDVSKTNPTESEQKDALRFLSLVNSMKTS